MNFTTEKGCVQNSENHNFNPQFELSTQELFRKELRTSISQNSIRYLPYPFLVRIFIKHFPLQMKKRTVNCKLTTELAYILNGPYLLVYAIS